MATGATLRAAVGDLLATYTEGDGTTAEDLRCMANGTYALKEIVGKILAVDEDFLLVSATFPTVADRSPNRYSLPDDLENFRYLERVVDDTTGSYVRIWPVQHIGDKEYPQDRFEQSATAVTASAAPDGYLIGSDFIQLFPISDAVYTMRIWYDKALGSITDSGTISLPDPFLPALYYKTVVLERAYRNEPIADWHGLYERALANALMALHQRSDDGPRIISYLDHEDSYI